MTSFFLAFVHPVPSLGPNNHGFQRICGAGTMTGFVFFFFSTALESLKIPFFFSPWNSSLKCKQNPPQMGDKFEKQQ